MAESESMEKFSMLRPKDMHEGDEYREIEYFDSQYYTPTTVLYEMQRSWIAPIQCIYH